MLKMDNIISLWRSVVSNNWYQSPALDLVMTIESSNIEPIMVSLEGVVKSN